MRAYAPAAGAEVHACGCERMRRYTSAYVPMQNNPSALGDLGALSWLAGMSALVCAGLESSTCLNFDGDSRRMRAYALGATGDRSINSCADSRRMRAYMRAYARMEYKPGFTDRQTDKPTNEHTCKFLRNLASNKTEWKYSSSINFGAYITNLKSNQRYLAFWKKIKIQYGRQK